MFLRQIEFYRDICIPHLIGFLFGERVPPFPPATAKARGARGGGLLFQVHPSKEGGWGEDHRKRERKKKRCWFAPDFPSSVTVQTPKPMGEKKEINKKKEFLCLFAFYIFLCVRRMYLRSGIKGGKRNRGKVIRRLSIHSVLLFLHCLDATLQ